MRKLFAEFLLSIAAVCTAQNTKRIDSIEGDIEIHGPVEYILYESDTVLCKPGCTFTLEFWDFHSAGGTVNIDIYNPDGKSIIHKRYSSESLHLMRIIKDSTLVYAPYNKYYTYSILMKDKTTGKWSLNLNIKDR